MLNGRACMILIKIFSIFLYFIVLVPAAILMRICRIKKFNADLDKECDTYWLLRDKNDKPTERYRRQD
jgi:hypothetical protein